MNDMPTWNRKIEELQKQLENQERLSSLGLLSAGIAHEIRNPLNFIINFARVSQNLLGEYRARCGKGTAGNGAEEWKEMDDLLMLLDENLQKIVGHGNHALDIINGILLYSRGTGSDYLSTDVIGLTREYVHLSYHAMRANYKGFNASIEEEYEEGMPTVNLIPQDYIRALLNVMNNAWYAVWKKSQRNLSGYRPVVRIALYRTNGRFVLVVEDNGTGMDQETQEHIYEMFYTTKPAGHGTGIGMAIVKDIIENKHRGSISFSSVPEEGTCFTLSIPLDL